jgi:hypothetical protein
MVVLLLFAMFAVDISFAYVQRRQMQNAADAAALAGARELTIAQGMGDDATLTNGGLYAILLDWAQRNQAQTVQALYVRPNGNTFAINSGDGATVPGVQSATGVFVNACTSWPTFFSRFVGLNVMNMCAEAEASFGAAWAVRGMAPLAVLYSDFQVGDEYSLFAGNYKHAAARWGWLGLDCGFPSKCSPDANSAKNWMENGYQGYVSRNSNYMADPGMKESVLHEANVGQVLILPLFDKVYQYTTDEECNKDSPRYDLAVCANACKQDYPNVVCAYTDQTTLKGQYYYHIIAFAAFEVSNVGQHQLDGTFVSYIVDGTWTNPSPWDKGVVVMRLTERDKPTATMVGHTAVPTTPPQPTNTAAPTGTPGPSSTPAGPSDTPQPTDTPSGPTATPAPTATPCLTPNAPTALSGIRSGENVYLAWNAPSGPAVTEYRIYWATSQYGTYGYLTSTTVTSYSYKTTAGRWYYVKAANSCGEGQESNRVYVPAG